MVKACSRRREALYDGVLGLFRSLAHVSERLYWWPARLKSNRVDMVSHGILTSVSVILFWDVKNEFYFFCMEDVFIDALWTKGFGHPQWCQSLPSYQWRLLTIHLSEISVNSLFLDLQVMDTFGRVSESSPRWYCSWARVPLFMTSTNITILYI